MKIVSADLGKADDYAVTALVLGSPAVPREYHVQDLNRWRGVKYQVTVKRLVTLANLHRDALVVLDAGGVGAAVSDLVREALPARKVYAVTATGGRNANPGREAGDVNVPKADLVAATQVALQNRRLTFSPSLALLRELQSELQRFESKLTKSLNLTYEGASGTHDDLASAVMLAVWLGEQAPKPITDETVAGWVLTADPDEGKADRKPKSRLEEIYADLPALFRD